MTMKLAIFVLFAAVGTGVGAGAVLNRLDAPPPAPFKPMKTATVLPYVAEAAEDREWKSRADDSAAAATAYVPPASAVGAGAHQGPAAERPVKVQIRVR